jgi:hypothetical protein
MAGFTSNDQIIAALTAGQNKRIDWTKNFSPTASSTAVANEGHFMARGNGNPPPDAIFNAGTNDLFQPVTETTTSAGCIQHGGNVSPAYKFLLSGSAVTAAATVAPCTMVLIDVIGFHRVTTMSTTSARNQTNTLAAFSTFTAADTDIVTHTNINLMPYTRVRLTTTAADLPDPLAIDTDYYVIKLTDLTCKLATSYANAVAGTAVNITDAGTGTHTMNTLYPRYTNGVGINAFFFNNNSTAMGAGTPNLILGYTNAAQTGSRGTPTVYPVGKTAATNTHILHTGATAAGKYNFSVPLQAGDTGIAQIDTIRNDATYTSNEYSVALYKELARFPISTLGLAAERNFLYEMPSLPRIYDGAALYWVILSGVATPVNSGLSGHLDVVWN